jgi:hypothetical protein
MKARAYISILVLLMSMVLPSYAKESISEMKECHQEVSFDDCCDDQGSEEKHECENCSCVCCVAINVMSIGFDCMEEDRCLDYVDHLTAYMTDQEQIVSLSLLKPPLV